VNSSLSVDTSHPPSAPLYLNNHAVCVCTCICPPKKLAPPASSLAAQGVSRELAGKDGLHSQHHARAPRLHSVSVPSSPGGLEAACVHFGCLWFPHRRNIPAWELGAASVQRHGQARPAARTFPSQRLCLMPNPPSHCLTVLSPLLAAGFGSRPFPRRLVSSPLLQTCVRAAHTSLGNRLFFTLATKALSALQNKQNQPAYNTAAALHRLVSSRTQKGPELGLICWALRGRRVLVPTTDAAESGLSPAGLQATATANRALVRFLSETFPCPFYVAVAPRTHTV